MSTPRLARPITKVADTAKPAVLQPHTHEQKVSVVKWYTYIHCIHTARVTTHS